MLFVFPVLSFCIERLINGSPLNIPGIGKWFIFYAAGWRLFIAGIRQAINPAFTAKEIFHFTGVESFPVIKELGFANICLGLTGIFIIYFSMENSKCL